MPNTNNALKVFLGKNYKMDVILDNGLHRHLSFKHNGEKNESFEITTWPGHLCFSGDMGCFVFSRMPDMIPYFSGKIVDFERWAQKCVSGASNNNQLSEFSFSRFQDKVKDELSQYTTENDFDDAMVEAAKSELENLEYIDEDEISAINYLRDADGSLFEDYQISNFHIWTYHYAFACLAVNFACNQYIALTDKT